MEQLQSVPPLAWGIGGVGLFLLALSPMGKAMLSFLLSKIMPSFGQADVIAAYGIVKSHCASSPEALGALKVVWVHLEPGEESPGASSPKK